MINFSNKNLVIIFLFFCFFSPPKFSAQEAIQDTLSLIKSYQTKAENSILSQDFETALINYNNASLWLSDSKDNLLKSNILIGFSKLHYKLHNYKEAESKVLQAINILNKTEDKLSLGKSYNILGSIFIKTGRFSEAEQYLKDADIIFTNLNDEKNRALTILNIGLLELSKNNPQVAINYFEAALPILISNKLSFNEAIAYQNEAVALLSINNKNIHKAKKLYEKAEKIINLNSYSELKIEGYRIASQIEIKNNNKKQSIELINLYNHKKDSIYQTYILAIYNSLENKSNIAKLNQDIAILQEELTKKQKSINFSKMTTGLSIALIIILSLLALSLFKNNNLRAKANDLLKDKNIELTLAKEKAEKASLAKAQFLSTITHELRTPLYAVTGLTHLLLEEDPTPNQKEHLNSLKFSGEYLLTLINNILDLNKLEANKVEVEKTVFNLKKRIEDVLITLNKTAKDQKNSLNFEYDESLPEKLIGDPLKLSQVLINLIGNSVKFTQNGDVTVRVKKLNSTKDKVNLRIEIEDTGVGISKNKQKSIFETFKQGSLQINRKFGGSGLGLSIVKNLLELMNSKIYLESTLGQGSRFWLDISFGISETLSDVSKLNNKTYNIDYQALENVSVLVVEDNKINQMITKKILEKNKLICKVADNGMDAIKMVHENNFKLILMDIHMPGISGIETTQRIREFNKELPIIALTAVTIDENLDEFYKAGFNEIIPKPFKPEDFFEKIYQTLEASKAKDLVLEILP